MESIADVGLVRPDSMKSMSMLFSKFQLDFSTKQGAQFVDAN